MSYAPWGNMPDELWLPVGFFKFFKQPPFGSIEILVLTKFWLLFVALSAIGLFTRISLIMSAVLYYLLVGFTLSFGEASFDDLGTVIFLCIFAFSDAGRSYSFDRFFTKKYSTPFSTEGRYRWPLRLTQVVFCSIFFAAGYSKLLSSGFAWFTTDTLQNYFIWAHYRSTLDDLGLYLGLGLWLSKYPWLCKAGALFSLILELLAPLALLNTRLRPILIISLELLLIGFYFTSTNGFMNMLALGFCWIPYGTLIKKLKI